MSDRIKDDNINYEEINNLIRNWIHYSKLSLSLLKQYKNTNELSEIYEKKVNDYLCSKNIENAKIKTTEGTMQFVQEPFTNDLTITSLENHLNNYFIEKGNENETINIMKYIHKNRKHGTQRKLRRC